MPNRRDDFKLQKVTLNLYDGDFSRLQELFPREGAGKIIRKLVRHQIKKVEELVSAQPRVIVEETDGET